MPVNTQEPITATWRLSGRTSDETQMRLAEIDVTPFTIGRGPDRDLRLGTPTVSSMHAEIISDADRLLLRDLGSTNGTFVNGVRLREECVLNEGDLVQFAQEVFRIEPTVESQPSRTMTADSADHALSLIQFDKLITERAVVPHFQPIVDMHRRSTLGYEVLGRSRLYGLTTPRAMFDAASVLHLESELSRIMREEGVEQGAGLSVDSALFVNTHPKELIDIDLLLFSLEGVRESTPTRPLVLEIHEKAVTESDQMQTLRTGLNDLDIDLAYDDFGAGQARLVELADVPPDYLKFDIELIHGISTASHERQRLVESLVSMANELGVATLAEGVESEEEHEVCAQLGFKLGQGFLYGKPVLPSVCQS